MLSPSQTFSLKTPPFTSLSLLLSPFLVLLFPLSQQTVSPPQHLGAPQLRFLPSPSPATTAPPTYPPNLALLRRGQGQSQTSGAGQSSCPSDQVSCGNGCAYDCCDGQAGLNGWACRVSGEKCFTKSGYVGCCKGRDCPPKRQCFDYPPNGACDRSTDSCLACSDSATGYCVTETNAAVGLSVLYCATSSAPLSFVTGTAVRPLASASSGSNLGQGSFVKNSLSSPVFGNVVPTAPGSVSSSMSGGLSKRDVAGITIGTVAVLSFMVFGAAFLLLRHKKLAAAATTTEPQPVAPTGDHLPANGPVEDVRSNVPAWPVGVGGDHELRHWIPQELDGAEVVMRKQDVPGREPEAASSLVSPIKDDVEGLGQDGSPT